MAMTNEFKSMGSFREVADNKIEAVKGPAFLEKMHKMPGSVDYSSGANAVLVDACEEWCTEQLAKVGADPCEILATHFEDGVALSALLTALTDRKIKVRRKCKVAAQKMDNLQICIEFINYLPFDSENLSVQDFLHGNLVMIVPFVLKLIKLFDVAYLQKLRPKYKTSSPTEEIAAKIKVQEEQQVRLQQQAQQQAHPKQATVSPLWAQAQKVRPGNDTFAKLKAELDADVDRVEQVYQEETAQLPVPAPLAVEVPELIRRPSSKHIARYYVFTM